jgi:hypothetical protein
MSNNKNETPLSGHKQHKKELNPPFLANGLNMTTSSWFDERLPEMLWAVLVIGNTEREEALKFFRYIAKFIETNQECSDITLTGIAQLPPEKKIMFIKHFSGYSQEINNILRSLLLFPELPALKDWKEVLPESQQDSDWQKVSKGVAVTFWHQSQEATDCRWVKILCVILGGKLKFPRAMEDTVRGIFEYPNYGDLRHIRPFIRASEITPDPKNEGKSSNWSKFFWKYCFDTTGCYPEEAINKKIQTRQKKLADEMENSRKHYFNETKIVRNKLIDHFFASAQTSTIDSRHEGAFGLALYAVSLFIEIIFYRTSLSITGRLGLRALVETYITITYLLQKEKTEPRVWDDYRSYGAGQIKLIYLKLQELKKDVSSIELDEMDSIANEDKWVEFIPINLGHWDSANLRKMAEEVKLKDLYDKFYNYTSGFMHANWGAVRESIYQKCVNPLHRYHRVPTYDLPLMPSVTLDAIEITNNILESLSNAYPKFETRFTIAKIKEPQENEIKK